MACTILFHRELVVRIANSNFGYYRFGKCVLVGMPPPPPPLGMRL